MQDLTRQHAHARLDVARGLAAFAVFVAHAGDIFFLRLVGTDHPVMEGLSILSRHAVLVFFLMSGNLITHSIILNIQRNGRFDIAAYAAARVARIYPPFIGAILICLLVWVLIHGLNLPGAVAYGLPGDLHRIRDSFTLSMGEVVRALTMRGGLLEANGPLWSLYIEFQVYVVAMAVATLWRGGLLSRLWTCLLALAALWLLRGQWFFVLVWVLGAATAMTPPPRKVVAAGCLASLAILVVLALRMPELFSDRMDDISGYLVQLLCCVVYAAVLFHLRAQIRYPGMLIATGNFSYSLYVIHFPLLLLGLSLSQDWTGHVFGRAWVAMLLSMVCILAIVIPFAALTEQQGKFKRLLLNGLHRVWRPAAAR